MTDTNPTPPTTLAAKKDENQTVSYVRDWGERVFWTAAQAGVSTFTVEAAHLPSWLIFPITVALAFVKGLVAKHVGNSDSAAIGA